MKKTYIVLLILLAALAIWLILASRQQYEYPNQKELRLKINYLARMIKTPFSMNNELLNLREQNPEWMLFSLSFTTFALTNISNLDTSFKTESVALIDNAIQKALSDTVYKYYFMGKDPFIPAIDTTGSVLYFGHLNMMLGCYRLLTTDTKYNDLSDRLSESLYGRYMASASGCLQSYPGKIWIADNTAALASLKIHSDVTGSEYTKACAAWEKIAKAKYCDEHTGLLCSMVDPERAGPIEETRGSGIGWSIFFIYRFDPRFARELYTKFTANFSTNLGAVRLYREKYHNYATGSGDIDSGPLFLGYSLPANAFAFGDAVAVKDFKTAKQLQRLIWLGRKTVSSPNEISYETRLIDIQVSPLTESLFLYFETMTDWNTQVLRPRRRANQ